MSSSQRMKIIELVEVAKKYRRKTIFSSLSAVFERGKVYLLVGENGSGKTTLLKGILGLIRFSAGHINCSPIRHAFLPERISLPEMVTVYDFLVNIGRIKKAENVTTRVDELLKEWNLPGKKRIRELSKGMKQKLLIIQTLLTDADLYAFDEPVSGLDVDSQARFLKLVQKLKDDGKTLIISTHHPGLYPADAVISLPDGGGT
jgi:ABC-2 type transport system ATP-binding protein